MKVLSTTLGVIAGLTVMAGAAGAAPVITGGLSFAGNPGVNYFDPANAQPGYPFTGYGNEAGISVPIGSGVEFYYQDAANRDTADFTGNSVTITNVGTLDQFSVLMVFSSDIPGFFDNAKLTSDSFGGNFLVVNNTLSFFAPATPGPGSRTSVITFAGAAVPEPATWAMLIVGFGFVGAALRRGQQRAVRVSYSG